MLNISLFKYCKNTHYENQSHMQTNKHSKLKNLQLNKQNDLFRKFLFFSIQ